MEDPKEVPGLAFVLTDRPVPIAVARIDDERAPDGMVCLGTSLDGRLIARCVVAPEVADFVEQQALFAEPVPLALAAQAEDPGLQCRLFAIVRLVDDGSAEEGEQEDDEAPWAASVPSSNFDRLHRDEGTDADREEPTGEGQQAAVLLGHIVRFARDRRHPDDLTLEAADVLASIVSGKVSEVVDKVLEELLGNATEPDGESGGGPPAPDAGPPG